MKIKILKDYFDLELRRPVESGEKLEVSDKRAEKLLMFNYAEQIKESKKEKKVNEENKSE